MSPPANVRPPGLKNVGIEQHLDEQIPPDLDFRDETGKPVRLGDYFGKKPVILNLVYYQCPMLCGEVLSGLESALRVLKFDVGKEFDVLTVSFDPRETPDMATKKKAEFLKRYGRPGAAEWLALSYRSAGIDRRADQSCRLPVSIRSEDRTIRARDRDHGADAGGKDCAVLLRSRVCAQRFAAGIDPGLGEQDRQPGGPGAAVLLSLRSDDRKIRSDHCARSATLRDWRPYWSWEFS